MTLTRRAMLAQLGYLGGAGASLAALQSLGVISPGSAKAAGFTLPPGSGKGKKVVVLGAGIGGLVSAYELSKAGFDVTVLEARQRVGGRVWTIRGQDSIIQKDRPPQAANFAAGNYLNAGAARIPSSHEAILGYAKRFGVPLEPYINTNRATGWDFGGKVYRERQMVFDMHGRIAEYLSGAMGNGALDAVMPKAERDAFRQFIGFWGGLDDKGVYGPGSASGFKQWPGGYDTPGIPVDPLTVKQMLPGRAIALPYVFEAINDMQATMLQPVGGMDRIAAAIYEQVKSLVRLGVPVTAIRREGQGVRIDHAGGSTSADFAVVTLPGHLLARISNDFSPAKKTALKGIPYLPSAKVAFDSPRFWEDEGIYGGNAWTDRLNENVMYPSAGIGRARGVLVGAYVAGWTGQNNPDEFVAKPIAEQIAIARGSIEALHPGKSRLLGPGVAVNWGQVEYSEGVGAIGDDFGERKRGARYDDLLKPEGPIVFAGEHLSYVGLWQEGAALSAHHAIELVHQMAKA
ncbi:MAG: FAD-dependent oxidoreductase [Sphingomicrobium sp.]